MTKLVQFLVLFLFVHINYSIAAESPPITSGYVLTHEHPTQAMAFGGNYAFTGAKGNLVDGVMENGYTAHCGGCKVVGKCNHGEVKGMFASHGLGGDMGVHKSHMGPVHNSNSHIRYSTDWVREAFAPSESEYQDTNMKIMVAFAVESEPMCEQLYYANKGKGYKCSKGDSFASLKRQIKSIKSWVSRNSDWMEVAYSARDARRIVNNNKLAIIIGIESEYSFGAENRTFDPVDRLNRYYDLGVRTFYLAHKINSRLAGADVFLPKGSVPGRALRVTQSLAGCFYYDDAVGDFPLEGRLGKNLCDNNCGDNAFKGGKVLDKCAFRYGDISETNYLDYVTRGAGAFNGFNLYPKPPGFIQQGDRAGTTTRNSIERNNLGLSHDGERVVRAAMQKGMIVNIDHVSSRARIDIFDIATGDFGNYPLNALHNKPNERLSNAKGFKRHEYDFDRAELDFVKQTGGFFGLRMGPTDSVEYRQSGITENCPKTSTETAKMLAWLLDQDVSVGYSLDYSTVTEGVHSRTLRSCGTNISDSADQLHTYGRHITEGLSHIGVMKKWHKELEAIGLRNRYLNALKNNGVEQFIQMWENSETMSSRGNQIPRQTFASAANNSDGCKEDSDCANSEYCARKGLDVRKNICKTKLSHGKACTDKRQCSTNRCSWGFCADADECQSSSDCLSGQYCGDPISGKQSCKTLKSRGQTCTKASQCSTNRCSWGFCADAHECRSNSDCGSNQYCGDPISGKQSCKTLKRQGQACTKANQCSTGRCSWGFCADADECRSNSDCSRSQYCGDPISGKRKCKALKSRGQACTKGSQCTSGKCRISFTCK